MAAATLPAQNGRATTVKKTFSRQTSVTINIHADATVIWALLTDARGYNRWNSTIVSINGQIAPGEKIRLTSTLAPKRVFKLTIKEFKPSGHLIWGDALGNRIYTLDSMGKGITSFTMTEKIGGPMFPLFAGMIPEFDASFEQFAADLKQEAEKIMHIK